jgi:hypothetical protein
LLKQLQLKKSNPIQLMDNEQKGFGEELKGGFAPLELFFKSEINCFRSFGEVLDPIDHLMPLLGEVWGCEEPFATILMGYSEQGLQFHITVETPKISVFYPEIQKGDAIELFIDTRAVTQAKTTHRFCHHFFFLPEAFEGTLQGEITRFRTEESHPLCDASALECKIKKTKSGYSATIFLPSHALVGYAPQECPKVGFTYRISRSDGKKQYFALSNTLLAIESTPYLWSILRLVESEHVRK